MLISIVIPHLNQEHQLSVGLDAIHAQVGARAEMEIIVVDNGSERLPEGVCGAWPDVRLVEEPEPGPGPARNTGAALASGEILAFIDADCVAHPGWIAAIESAFTRLDVSIIGGDVQVRYADPLHPTPLEPYEAVYSYRNSEHIAEGFSGTGNLATRPDVLADVGPFAGIDVAEDRDWGLRAGALEYSIEYVPEMIVYHPARLSFSELCSKWDRHIAHDWADRRPGPLARTLWIGRSIAMAVSPVYEIPTVIRSPRISGPRDRISAFACLTAVRAYRAYRMLRLAITPTERARSRSWNRG